MLYTCGHTCGGLNVYLKTQHCSFSGKTSPVAGCAAFIHSKEVIGGDDCKATYPLHSVECNSLQVFIQRETINATETESRAAHLSAEVQVGQRDNTSHKTTFICQLSANLGKISLRGLKTHVAVEG